MLEATPKWPGDLDCVRTGCSGGVACAHGLLPPVQALQFDRQQVAALTEANKGLQAQVEELRQEAAR